MKRAKENPSSGDLSGMNDSELMQAVFDICNAGIVATVTHRTRRFRMSEDDIDDCVTTIYIQLFDRGCRKVRQFRGECSFKTFICAISDRILLDHIKKEMRVRDKTSGHDVMEPMYSLQSDLRSIPDRQLLEKERSRYIERCETLLARAMSDLPPAEYSALMFRFHQKKEYHEINDLMGIHNAAYLIKRALSRIRYSLGTDGEEIHRFIAEECAQE